MRILIATQTYYPGTNGQAVFTIGLAEELVKDGHQVVVVTPSHQGSPYRQRKNGVEVFGIRAIHLSQLHPTVYITPFPRIGVSNAMQAVQPQIVHIQDHYFLCASALGLAQGKDIPVLGTNHFLPDNVSENIPLVWGERLVNGLLWKWMLGAYNRVEAATTPTETAAQIVRQQGIKVPVFAISCGVDLKRFHPRPDLDRSEVRRNYGFVESDQVFMYVGRLDEEKQINTLLHAIQQLDRPAAKLLIVGRGGMHESLSSLSRQLGIQGQVIFAGQVSAEELPLLYNSADVFVMPSPVELQSIATLEAMASGMPILAADERALPELVTSGVNGYLFEVGNPEAISRVMAKMLESQDQWAEMGQNSLNHAQDHSVENTAKLYADLYRVVLNGELQTRGFDPVVSEKKAIAD